jgi:RND family efflux transporter MFP subunit
VAVGFSASPRKWLFFLPLLLGAFVLVLLVRRGDAPEHLEREPLPRSVRYIEAPVVTQVPRALGYGRARPVRVWEGVAEISGRILELHPELKKGALLPAESLLLRIDPSEYELAVSRAQADILATQAQLAEMGVKESNTRASLEIEAEALGLREVELRRKRDLVKKGTLSASEFEQEQRALLAQRQQVQAQQNALNLLPAERQLLEAQLARYEAQLASARLDLSRTEVRLPFRARISEVNVEAAQYVRQGASLVKADAIDKAEVEAQIPIARMRSLLNGGPQLDLGALPPGQLARSLGIRAQVWLRDGGLDVSWDAKFVRMSDTLDPDTRTIGVIVEVDAPYADVQPGVRPPLVKGLFVEVELRGRPRPGSLVIPRQALHDGQVYLLGVDDRLEVRPVETAQLQPEYVVIASGLEPGERVLVSDLIPAAAGMALAGQPDPEVLGRLLATAMAEDFGVRSEQ